MWFGQSYKEENEQLKLALRQQQQLSEAERQEAAQRQHELEQQNALLQHQLHAAHYWIAVIFNQTNVF